MLDIQAAGVAAEGGHDHEGFVMEEAGAFGGDAVAAEAHFWVEMADNLVRVMGFGLMREMDGVVLEALMAFSFNLAGDFRIVIAEYPVPLLKGGDHTV